MMVDLYLQVSRSVNNCDDCLQLIACSFRISRANFRPWERLQTRGDRPGPRAWTPAKLGVWAAGDMALGSVLESLHADVWIGPQTRFAYDWEISPLRIIVLKKPGCHYGEHRSVLVTLYASIACSFTLCWSELPGDPQSSQLQGPQ
jgi:hypothetical protein